MNLRGAKKPKLMSIRRRSIMLN